MFTSTASLIPSHLAQPCRGSVPTQQPPPSSLRQTLRHWEFLLPCGPTPFQCRGDQPHAALQAQFLSYHGSCGSETETVHLPSCAREGEHVSSQGKVKAKFLPGVTIQRCGSHEVHPASSALVPHLRAGGKGRRGCFYLQPETHCRTTKLTDTGGTQRCLLARNSGKCFSVPRCQTGAKA